MVVSYINQAVRDDNRDLPLSGVDDESKASHLVV